MKKTKLLLLSPLLLLLALLWAGPRQFLLPLARAASPAADATAPEANRSATISVPGPSIAAREALSSSDSIVAYAMSLLGSPYVYAGISPEGFDCSGFITHVFGKFAIKAPHSSAMQAEVGAPVVRENARAGDLVIFTGTNPEVREPGHVGLVISSPGDTIKFVHASSNGGVKVSKVEGTRYDLRFLQIRRIL